MFNGSLIEWSAVLELAEHWIFMDVDYLGQFNSFYLNWNDYIFTIEIENYQNTDKNIVISHKSRIS